MSSFLKKDNKVYLDSLIIIGFNLYPKCKISFDKTFTSIFGKNGVGKTTLLDAIQIGLIANQQYTKFNVTTLKDDRSLGDYMLGSAGFILFNVKKSNVDTFQISFGLRLIKNPDTKVDIKTFAVTYKNLEPDDFFKEDMLIDNFQQLNRELLIKYPDSNLILFNTISEYHQFLYDNGILGVNISSKISDFSLLYRSISTGLLRQSKKMIKEILSSKDFSAKKIFKHLADTMRQRVEVVRKIENIRKIKEEITSLKEAEEKYYSNAYKYFCSKYNKLISDLKITESEILKKEELIKKYNNNLEKTEKDISIFTDNLEYIEGEIEKLLRNISDFERNYNAFEEYSTITKKIEEQDKSLTILKNEKKAIESSLRQINIELIKLKEKEDNLRELFYKLNSEKELYKVEYDNFIKFTGSLKRFLDCINEKAKTFQDFNNVIHDWESIVKNIENLPYIKKEYQHLLEKLKLFNEANLLKNQLLKNNIIFKNREELISISEQLENKVFKLKNHILEIEKDIENKNNEINELLKGKIVLPDALKNFKGKFLYKFFDEVSIDEGKEIEAILGTLKYAAIVKDEEEAATFADGKETLYFIKNPYFSTEKFKIKKQRNGYLIYRKDSNIIRYEPEVKYPVIGEKARKKRVENLLKEMENLKKILQNNEEEVQSISSNITDINRLLNIFYAFDYENIEKEVKEKKRFIEYIEDKAIVYKQLKTDFQNVLKLKQYFGRDDIKESYEKISVRLKEVKAQLDKIIPERKELEEKLKGLNEKNIVFDEKIKKLEIELNGDIKIKTRLEYEFPEHVLTGKIDFSEIKVLQNENKKLHFQKKELQKKLDGLKELRVKILTDIDNSAEKIKQLKNYREGIKREIENLLYEGKKLFFEEIKPVKYEITEGDYIGSKAIFEKEIDRFLKKHEKEPSKFTNIQEIFNDVVIKVYPNFSTLSKLHDDLENLNAQLINIEKDIKKVIDNFKAGIEENIFNVKRKLKNINKDLENVRFGKIRKITLKLEERPAYYKLQKIHESGSILSLLEKGGENFNEFIKELSKNIGYNRSQVTEEDVLDYRNYFDVEVELFDEFGNKREKGLSNGENLGTNIVIVLSMLTRMSDESIKNKMLPIVLDEADRLDVESLNTIYEIAENWGIQLIVALPNIPSFNKGIHYHLIAGENGVVMPHVRFE